LVSGSPSRQSELRTRKLVLWLVSRLKGLAFPAGRSAWRIKSGSFRGLKMELDLSWQSQVYIGLYEREVYPWLNRLSAGVETALDIGAAEGAYTLFFLKKSGAKRVLAFEPLESSLRHLVTNLRLNGLEGDPRLHVRRQFVGVGSAGETTLDSLLPEISFPCIVKVDVDGPEAEILDGAEGLMRCDGVRWLIETHSRDLERACAAKLAEFGYRVTIVPKARWRAVLPEGRPIEHNQWLVATRERLA
jgi:hypothetical protein